MTKDYHFIRKGDEVEIGLLNSSLKLHRPDQLATDVPLEWGTASDGARILAYSLLNDCLGTEKASYLCSQFVKQILAPLTLNEWRISETQLAEFCEYQMRIKGMVYQSVIEGMKPANWSKPTTYQTIPAMPLWTVNPNISLQAPRKESVSKK